MSYQGGQQQYANPYGNVSGYGQQPNMFNNSFHGGYGYPR